MNLLLDRKQRSSSFFSLVPLRFGSGVVFDLHAELELTDEETQLITKYKITDAKLTDNEFWLDIRKAFGQAMIVSFVVFIGVALIIGVMTAAGISALLLVAMTAVYFYTQQTLIVVKQLMNGGRSFHCDGVVRLIRTEAFLQHCCEYLRQVLESSKHWGERESIPIKVLDKDDAKRAVLTATPISL